MSFIKVIFWLPQQYGFRREKKVSRETSLYVAERKRDWKADR
jgi:hypothetical protein